VFIRIIQLSLPILFVALSIDGSIATALDVPSKVNVDHILQAWKERSEKIQSIEALWEHDQTDIEFWSTYQADTKINPHAPNKFLLRGNAFRYETKRRNRHSFREYSGFERKFTYRTFDNAINNQLTNIENYNFKVYNFTKIKTTKLISELFTHSENGYSFAHINSLDAKKTNLKEFLIDDLIVVPFLLYFRPLEYISSKKEGFQTPLKHSNVNGIDCIVLDRIMDSYSFRYWIDPAKGCSIIRMISFIDQFPCTQLDIKYSTNVKTVLFPSSWKSIVFDNNDSYPGRSRIFQYTQVDVLECKTNSNIQDQELIPVYPDMTLVENRLKNKTFLKINEKETRSLNVSETKLLASDTFSTPSVAKQSKLLNWNLIGGCVLFLAGYLFIKMRMLYLKRLQSSPKSEEI
jgi:hypothetical protein